MPAVKKLARTPVLPRGVHSGEEVLNFVIKIIEDEPRRLYMGDWLSMFKGEAFNSIVKKRPKPSCGTVACLAGWIGVATGRNAHTGSYAAFDALGLLNTDTTDEGYNKYRLRQDLYSLFVSTKLRRSQVIRNLRDIMQKYSYTLREIKVTVE